MTNDKFSILIGSFARGTNDLNSDIDILRIGNFDSVSEYENLSKVNPISYIDYDYDTFSELYKTGSLFLHHAFTEGKVLKGSIGSWDNLKNRFSVSSDFSETINEYKYVLGYINKYPEYEDSYIPYLSNIFKSLKNIAIFKLAERSVYEFDKSKALSRQFGLSDEKIRYFIGSNNSFERGCLIPEMDLLNLKQYAKTWKYEYKIFEKRNLS